MASLYCIQGSQRAAETKLWRCGVPSARERCPVNRRASGLPITAEAQLDGKPGGPWAVICATLISGSDSAC